MLQGVFLEVEDGRCLGAGGEADRYRREELAVHGKSRRRSVSRLADVANRQLQRRASRTVGLTAGLVHRAAQRCRRRILPSRRLADPPFQHRWTIADRRQEERTAKGNL